jgi:EAL domain-containing protein (putative c-di-GMP-specific phosphodiesterase class I)
VAKKFAAENGNEGSAIVFAVPECSGWTEDEIAEIQSFVSVAYLRVLKEELREKIEITSLTNYLTGLPNAGGFLKKAGELEGKGVLAEYDSYYYNLKGTGLLNMRYGGEESDRIIQRYAGLCRDFVTGDECIAHFGGDNFVALIRKDRRREFRMFLNEAKTFAIISGTKVPVSLKSRVGMMRIPEQTPEPWMVIAGPATALSYAKAGSIDYVELTDEMVEKANRQKEMQQSFGNALKKGEFVSFYQPKVDIETGKIVGVEALVRWIHDGVEIQPDNFIPILERAGLTEQLDLYILEESCKNMRRWIDSGKDPVILSVNFSRRDLEDPELSKKIIRIIQRYGIDKRCILVEMTETTSEKEKHLMMNFMNAMSEYEILTSIDDFGTGYSSLSSLRDYTVNEIKIDKSFISHNRLQEKDRAIIGSIIKMAELLHVDVITEGVENMDQVKFLHDLGCTKVQGYLYGKPLPPENFEDVLEKKYIGDFYN